MIKISNQYKIEFSSTSVHPLHVIKSRVSETHNTVVLYIPYYDMYLHTHNICTYIHVLICISYELDHNSPPAAVLHADRPMTRHHAPSCHVLPPVSKRSQLTFFSQYPTALCTFYILPTSHISTISQ